VEKKLTFAVIIEMPPDGGRGGPVIAYRQDAANEQVGRILELWRN
jgi:hypothetical protein